MADWWADLLFMEQIFFAFAIPATIVLVIQTVMLLIGIGGDETDIGDTDGDGGLALFSVRGFVTFFTLFGWTGLVILQWTGDEILSVIIAFIAGALGMFITAYLFKKMASLAVSGTISLTNAVGKTATVYIRVPALRANRGKVNVVVQEKLIEVDAVTDEDTDLTAGKEVIVVGLTSADTVLVAAKGK
jgi:hypothetical protein